MAQITFIGGGNMAAAIIGGLIGAGQPAKSITVSDPNAETRAGLEARFGIHVTDQTGPACAGADTIILAVKPQILPAVAAGITAAVDLDGKLIISIAAGITLERLEALLGPQAIARAMPNTPAMLGLGATGLFANARTSAPQRAEAERIIASFGLCVPVAREELLEALTAVSGSGPAYFFLMIEEMARSGAALGLSAEESMKLAVQTALGAASMAAAGDLPPDALRRNVTSPGGATHAAITAFQEAGFGEIVTRAMTACRDRAIELGKG